MNIRKILAMGVLTISVFFVFVMACSQGKNSHVKYSANRKSVFETLDYLRNSRSNLQLYVERDLVLRELVEYFSKEYPRILKEDPELAAYNFSAVVDLLVRTDLGFALQIEEIANNQSKQEIENLKKTLNDLRGQKRQLENIRSEAADSLKLPPPAAPAR